jgi:hypothetical protein
MGEAIEDLAVAVATERWVMDIYARGYFWNGRLLEVNQDFLVPCAVVFNADFARNGIIGQHAYIIIEL